MTNHYNDFDTPLEKVKKPISFVKYLKERGLDDMPPARNDLEYNALYKIALKEHKILAEAYRRRPSQIENFKGESRGNLLGQILKFKYHPKGQEEK